MAKATVHSTICGFEHKIEVKVDIGRHVSKPVDELPVRHFDVVITLCGHAHETCPFFPGGAKKIHVGFDDPPELVKSASIPEESLAYFRRPK